MILRFLWDFVFPNFNGLVNFDILSMVHLLYSYQPEIFGHFARHQLSTYNLNAAWIQLQSLNSQGHISIAHGGFGIASSRGVDLGWENLATKRWPWMRNHFSKSAWNPSVWRSPQQIKSLGDFGPMVFYTLRSAGPSKRWLFAWDGLGPVFFLQKIYTEEFRLVREFAWGSISSFHPDETCTQSTHLYAFFL